MRVIALLALSAALLLGAQAGHGFGLDDEADKATLDPRFVEAERFVKAKDYAKALPLLDQVIAADATNADAYNYLGYSQRKLGDFAKALVAYGKALAVSPDHKGANEYLGELYLELKDLPKAEERLAHLARICAAPCEEHAELAKAIEAYKKGPGA